MAVGGINHITLSVDDVPRALAFYRDVLGCRVLAEWPKGAYLSAGGTWLALVDGPSQPVCPDDHTHIAFDVAPHEFDATVAAIHEAGCDVWQENWTEGDSLYFRDPAGHQLEVHATTLAQRLAAAEAAPWPGLVIDPEARTLAAAAPTVRHTKKPRRFSCSPVGVCVLILDGHDRALLLRHGSRARWEAVSGALEAGETLEGAARREVREELGADVRLGPLTTVHAYTVDYDPDLPPLLSVVFAARYRGGDIRPGDDMTDAEATWTPVTELAAGRQVPAVPTEARLFSAAARLLAVEEGQNA